MDQGAGLVSLGTFTPVTASNGATRLQYYDDFGLLTGVDALQLRVQEADVSGDNGPAVVEMEALLLALPESVIPEPATMALLGIGGLGLLIRRRRQA